MTYEMFTLLIILGVFYVFIAGLVFMLMYENPVMYFDVRTYKMPTRTFSYILALLFLSLSWIVLPIIGIFPKYFFSKES